MKSIIKFVLAITLLMSMPSFSWAKTRLVVNCFWPPKHFMCRSILPTWIKWVEEATDGRVTGIIPPKSLAPPPEQWNSVVKGVADVAPQFNGLVQNRIQGPLVAMNMFIGSDDAPAMSQALWETHLKYFPDEFQGVKYLSGWVITPGLIWSQTDEPILSVAELAKRKIWTLPGPPARLLKSIGSNPVAGPAVQANEIISRKVVDGFIVLSPNSVDVFQLAPYTKSGTVFKKGMYTTSFSLLMNEDKWNGISKKDQEAIMAVSGSKFGRMASQHWVDRDGGSLKKITKDGKIKMYEAPAEFENELKKQAAKITAGWIKKAGSKGIDSKGALDFYIKRVNELSK